MICLDGKRVVRRFDKELLVIEAWGRNGLRVRATHNKGFSDEVASALGEAEVDRGDLREWGIDQGALGEAEVDRIGLDEEGTFGGSVGFSVEMGVNGKSASIRNGKLRCELMGTGKLKFFDDQGGLLLEEFDRNRFREEAEGEFNSALEINPRTFSPIQNTGNYGVTVRFEANEGERLYGMGQYQQPFLDLKGCVLELAHRNSQASVPFVVSNRGYGLLWNNPAIGTVTFGKNVTEWTAVSTKQMDYWITAGDTPAEIVEAYADVTGKVPVMPEYGLGFWQCKLRYQTQEELLNVAREYKKRGLPISVIVVDYFHWPHQGDWCFDEDYFPDAGAMVQELKEMGIELMVSVWPTVEADSVNYKEMEELGYLTRSEYGKRIGQLGDACFIDPTSRESREYVWSKIKKNYYEKGIRIFWLDEAEPEFTDYEFSHYRYAAGSDMETGNIFPKEYARMAYEGMEKEGQENIVNLLRCAWAGSQKYGALVWSGDIDSSFRSLRSQLAAGLNMGMAGIPWWTTDIGGFHGGNIDDPNFHELFVRWFEFGTFCPVMRLHGNREPFQKPLGLTGGGKCNSGADNEVWTYGEEVYEICKTYMELREKMKPYLRTLMKAAHEKGTPVMRPLFYDFPEDEKAWTTEDQYMFGADLMVAPILYENLRKRRLYLPEGSWRHLFSQKVYEGKREIEIEVPINELPVFARNGALGEL